MNVLPRFLYLFQSLPVFLPKFFSHLIDKLLLSFIWGGIAPRLCETLLERPRQVGGHAPPNFMIYYWAANTQKILYWFQAPDTNWCSAEAKFCKLASLPALTTKLPFFPSHFSSSPVASSTLRIWIQFRQTPNLSDLSILSAISDNHLFPAAQLDDTFKQWNNIGLTQCKDLFIDDIFPSFTNLASTYAISKSIFLLFFAIFRSATSFEHITHHSLHYKTAQI